MSNEIFEIEIQDQNPQNQAKQNPQNPNQQNTNSKLVSNQMPPQEQANEPSSSSKTLPQSCQGQDEEKEDLLTHHEIDGITMIEYKKITKVLELILAFTGMFAGFQGFIINAYTSQDTPLKGHLLDAVVLMYVSFMFNVVAAAVSLLLVVIAHLGYVDKCFKITFIAIPVFFSIFAETLYGIAFLKFIWATKMDSGRQWFIVGLEGVFSGILLCLVIYFVTKILKLDDKKRSKRLQISKFIET